jgi:hypothetical protein
MKTKFVLRVLGWLYVLDAVQQYGKKQYYKGRDDQSKVQTEVKHTIIITKTEEDN